MPRINRTEQTPADIITKLRAEGIEPEATCSYELYEHGYQDQNEEHTVTVRGIRDGKRVRAQLKKSCHVIASPGNSWSSDWTVEVSEDRA